jgi:hypothetical protein
MVDLTPQKHLELARAHLDRVQVAAIDPVDWADIGNYGLYALEAAVMAAAKVLKIETKPSHWSKSDTAAALAGQHGLPDVSRLMAELNDARKASNYGDVALPENLDPEDVATEIGDFVSAVEDVIKRVEDE